MKNFVKGFLVATLIFAVTLTGYASSKMQTIEVELNPATIKVEWEPKEVDHFIYKGTTYVPLRTLSEMLDTEVSWDSNEKSINLYKVEPRSNSLIFYANIPQVDDRERNIQYDTVLTEIQKDLINLLNELESIDLLSAMADVDIFLDYQFKRAAIENRIYQETFDVNYRTPIFHVLEALDNIELSLIRAHNGGNLEQIEMNLKKAREHIDYILFLGF